MTIEKAILQETWNMKDGALAEISTLAFEGKDRGSDWCDGFNAALELLAGYAERDEILDSLRHEAGKVGLNASAIALRHRPVRPPVKLRSIDLVDELVAKLDPSVTQNCEGSAGETLLAGWVNAKDMAEEGVFDREPYRWEDYTANFCEAALSEFNNMGWQLADLVPEFASASR